MKFCFLKREILKKLKDYVNNRNLLKPEGIFENFQYFILKVWQITQKKFCLVAIQRHKFLVRTTSSGPVFELFTHFQFVTFPSVFFEAVKRTVMTVAFFLKYINFHEIQQEARTFYCVKPKNEITGFSFTLEDVFFVLKFSLAHQTFDFVIFVRGLHDLFCKDALKRNFARVNLE